MLEGPLAVQRDLGDVSAHHLPLTPGIPGGLSTRILLPSLAPEISIVPPWSSSWTLHLQEWAQGLLYKLPRHLCTPLTRDQELILHRETTQRCSWCSPGARAVLPKASSFSFRQCLWQ